MSKVLCVLGMHRSGTSIVANWLNNSGLHLGSELLRADFSNKSGHFEDMDFLNFHKGVLEDAGLLNSGLELTELPLMSSKRVTELQKIIQQKQGLPQWGWKDPRTVLFIEHYLKIIPDIKILMVYRPYRKVLKSLLNRDLLRKQINEYPGRKGLIKWVWSKEKEKEKLFKKWYPIYTKSLIIYFIELLNLLKNLSNDQLKVIKYSDIINIHSTGGYLISFWKFDLTPVPVEDIFSQEKKTTSLIKLKEIPKQTELENLESEILDLIKQKFSFDK